jgi:hypothetical protein
MIKFYHLFKTTCIRDGSAYFGIRENADPMWDEHVDYIGNGPKLIAKINQYGGPQFIKQNFKVEVLYTSVHRDEVERQIAIILTPATYADPLCLNVSPVETAAKIAEAHTGLKQAELTKHTIASSMMRNDNALGHVKSEETKVAMAEERSKQKLKWIHNVKTREERQIPAEELEDVVIDDGTKVSGMITGFQLGRLPKKLRDMGPVPADTSKKYVDY